MENMLLKFVNCKRLYDKYTLFQDDDLRKSIESPAVVTFIQKDIIVYLGHISPWGASFDCHLCDTQLSNAGNLEIGIEIVKRSDDSFRQRVQFCNDKICLLETFPICKFINNYLLFRLAFTDINSIINTIPLDVIYHLLQLAGRFW